MERFHLISKKLQSIDIDIDIDLRTIVSLYRTKILYAPSINNMYDVYETKSKL